MSKLVEKETGEEWEIPPDQMEAALASGLYDVPDGVSTSVVTAGGDVADVPVSELSGHLEQGADVESSDSFRHRQRKARIHREHGSLGQQVLTGVESAASTASLGLTDAVAGAIGGDEYRENRTERQEENPLTATGAAIAGAVAPSLLSGGSGVAGSLSRLTPAGKAAAISERIAARGGFRASTVGYGLDGALIGAGEAVSELALAEEPLSIERVGSTFSSKMLFGAATGGTMGMAGHAAQLGLRRAKKAMNEAASLRAPGSGAAGDLASMDKAGLEAAKREASLTLGEEAVEQAKAIQSSRDIYRVTSGSDKAVITKARTSLQRHLDNPKLTAEQPLKLRDAIYREEAILKKTVDNQEAVLAAFVKSDDALTKKLSKQIDEYTEAVKLSKQDAALYGDLTGTKVKSRGKGSGATLDKAELEEFRALIQSGAATKVRTKAMSTMEDALDRNLALQAHLKGIQDSTAPQLVDIKGALDDLSSGAARKPGMLEQVSQGGVFSAATGAAAPFIGVGAPILGAKVAQKVNGWIFGRMGKVAAESAARTTVAVDRFIDISAKASKLAPPVATKTLMSVQFSPDSGRLNRVTEPRTLHEAYRAREHEILTQTEPRPDGSRKMTMAARERLAEELSAFYEVAPKAADQLETLAARRIEFLASKIPKRPPVMASTFGPDTWRPSDMAIRQWARYVAAVEDPGSIEERLADGSVTPEDAEAMQVVYPERFAAIQMMLLERVDELRGALPYERRLALSIFSGVAVDPAMDPRILRVLQASFAEEPGTDGGTQAPRAQPQFGSISRPKPTAAQERAG